MVSDGQHAESAFCFDAAKASLFEQTLRHTVEVDLDGHNISLIQVDTSVHG